MNKNIPGLYTLGACDIFERLRYVFYKNKTARVQSLDRVSIVLRNLLYQAIWPFEQEKLTYFERRRQKQY